MERLNDNSKTVFTHFETVLSILVLIQPLVQSNVSLLVEGLTLGPMRFTTLVFAITHLCFCVCSHRPGQNGNGENGMERNGEHCFGN